MKSIPRAAESNPRQLGWPCGGMYKAGTEKSNQYTQHGELHPLWTSSTLREQDAPPRRYSSNWTSYGPGHGSTAAERLRRPAHDREDLQRQVDGDQGQEAGDVRWPRSNDRSDACRRAPGTMDDGRDGRGGDGCAESQPHVKAKAKATPTSRTREFSPAPRTPGQGSQAASQDDAIPPGSTVDKRSPQKPVKIKKEPIEQSVPVTRPSTSAAAERQSVPVVVSDVEVISSCDEEDQPGPAEGGREEGRLSSLWNSLENLKD